MKLTEKTLQKNYLYRGKILNLRRDDAELENGRQVTREVVEHPGGVCVAALNEKNEMVFVRQFRYPYSKVVLEIPAGKLEPGEDPFEAVKREQLEETGTRAEAYQFLGEMYPSPGYTDEIIRIWACRISQYGALKLDEGEFLETEYVPLETAVEMVLRNEIPDAKTQVAILKTSCLVKAGQL
ncbi:NUDIX domain-containing protein [Yeguia hominis]|uniref:NUDIX hydrolase n=1 Tax=Yeguia hominis TaxID=2763662 RepID=A0A926D9U3_9FIRM|nr:NUDIX hydrolase [Yeguia hominis]MBC8534007.1 NUDIX hydrolase [Yeguia hominis]